MVPGQISGARKVKPPPVFPIGVALALSFFMCDHAYKCQLQLLTFKIKTESNML